MIKKALAKLFLGIGLIFLALAVKIDNNSINVFIEKMLNKKFDSGQVENG